MFINSEHLDTYMVLQGGYVKVPPHQWLACVMVHNVLNLVEYESGVQ